jgi:tetratricopeptide (TPR) repeat protein
VACYWQGRWDEAIQTADEMFTMAAAGSPSYMDVQSHDVKAKIGLARGEAAAYAETRTSLELSRRIGDPQVLYPTIAFVARAWAFLGLRDEAVELLEELLSAWRSKPNTILHSHLQSFADAAAVLVALGRGPELEAIGAKAPVQTPWIAAATAFVRGDFPLAADIYARTGSLPDEAYARLRAAEALIQDGRRPEGDSELQRAFAFHRSVGATAYLREGEALLARTA